MSLSSVVPAIFFCYRLLLWLLFCCCFFFFFFFFVFFVFFVFFFVFFLCYYFNLISQLKPNFMRSLQRLREESLSKCSRSYVVLYYCHRHHFFLRGASLKQRCPRNAGSLFKTPLSPVLSCGSVFAGVFVSYQGKATCL